MINWTSPEHLNDLKGSAGGDVWAFGMTMLVCWNLLIQLQTLEDVSAGTVHSSDSIQFNP